MSIQLETVWGGMESQLRGRVSRLLGPNRNRIDPDEILNHVYQQAMTHPDRPADPVHLERWLMNLVRWRTQDALRDLDPSLSLQAEDDEPRSFIEPTARSERLAMSPESEQAVREGFERIRENEGVTPRDWTIYYLFQLRHLVEHTSEMTAEAVMDYFNTQPHYEDFARIKRASEVNRVSSRVQDAMNAQLALVSASMTERSFRMLAIVVRDYIASRHNKAPQEHQK
jgi:hypothetical protein